MTDTVPFDSADRDFGVLVGFDGSESARSARDWAAAEALTSSSMSHRNNCTTIRAG